LVIHKRNYKTLTNAKTKRN